MQFSRITLPSLWKRGQIYKNSEKNQKHFSARVVNNFLLYKAVRIESIFCEFFNNEKNASEQCCREFIERLKIANKITERFSEMV